MNILLLSLITGALIRKSQEGPGGARRSPEEPGGARRSPKEKKARADLTVNSARRDGWVDGNEEGCCRMATRARPETLGGFRGVVPPEEANFFEGLRGAKLSDRCWFFQDSSPFFCHSRPPFFFFFKIIFQLFILVLLSSQVNRPLEILSFLQVQFNSRSFFWDCWCGFYHLLFSLMMPRSSARNISQSVRPHVPSWITGEESCMGRGGGGGDEAILMQNPIRSDPSSGSKETWEKEARRRASQFISNSIRRFYRDHRRVGSFIQIK